MVLKLFAVSDGPPSLAVRQLLARLGLQHELVSVDYGAGEHMTPQYALIVDFYLYFPCLLKLVLICFRAIVNHRLSFNLSTYYANISAYTMAPIFYDYERTALGLKKVNMALDVFETYMERLGTSHAAADHLTIADFQLFNTNMTLEAINFDFSQYKRIQKWYDDFKKNYPDLWNISAEAMKEIRHFVANPPDLSHLNHPIHPARKANK